MPGPMEGVKVVEVGLWVAGPAAAAILGDWGADVVKIEPPDGDPFRGLLSALGSDGAEPAVRARQPQQAQRRVEPRPGRGPGDRRAAGRRRRRLRHQRPPASPWSGPASTTTPSPPATRGWSTPSVTGYGLDGRGRDRAAYDVGAFWSRAGVAASLTPEGADLPYQRGGMGDHMAGMAAAGAVPPPCSPGSAPARASWCRRRCCASACT